MVDGYTSSTIMTQFLKDLNPNANIKYICSFDKKHGLTFEDMSKFSKSEVEFIIIPDASMTVKDAIQIKENFNCDILVADHHEFSNEYLDTWTRQWFEENEITLDMPKERLRKDCYTNYCTWINSNDGVYPNPSLSGAGVVMKLIEAYDEKYGVSEDMIDSCYELVSLGLIADAMDLRYLETRWYALEGLKDYYWHNDFIQELCSKLADEMPQGRTIYSMSWNIAPKINGVCRYGTDKEIIDLFRAMVGEQEKIIYQPKRKKASDPKPDPEEHTLQWDMARVCCNVKTRQDTAVRAFMEKVEDIIKDTQAYKNSILFVDCSDVIDKKTVTGLVANKLASKYYRPVVLMRDFSPTEYGGSMRNYSQGNVEDLKSLLEKAGLTVHGHKAAAGIRFEKSKLAEIQAKCDELLPIESLTTIHTVDWTIPLSELKNEYISEVASNYAIWGNTVPTPTFAITGIHINASQITRSGPNGTKRFIRFKANNISFIKKYCATGEFDTMTMKDSRGFGVSKKNLIMNIIGEFQYDRYDDKDFPVVKILFYDVEEDIEATETQKQNQAGGDWSEIEEVETKPKKIAKFKIDEDEYGDDFVF